MSQWCQEIPVDGVVELPPEPRAMESLGRNHTLETAVADLVDNSLDADASHVLIRFVQDGPRLVALCVVDNGRGIAPDAIDTAMTLGGHRDYGASDLGRFGVGLKAASFSQAASLTVMSRASGHEPVGRRWLANARRSGFQCDRVPTDFAGEELDRAWSIPIDSSGTVVRWDAVSGFPSFAEPEQVEEFLSRTVSHLQGHLGLTFHRILSDRNIRIVVDVEDTRHGVGLAHPVRPLDPFAYPHSPSGWPKTLVADAHGTQLVLTCHIWPGRSNLPEYRLPGGPEARQGLYFYRRDRLLHAGGWEGVTAPDKKLQLARAAIDIDGDITHLFVMNPEKSRVSVGPDFARVISSARASDSTTVTDYLRAAEDAWTASNRRVTARRSPVLPPGKGVHPRVSREIRDELPQLNDEPLKILWKHLNGDEFFEVDRETNTLWINQAYRRALLGGRRGGLNDLPLLKALLFLLLEGVFEGQQLGSRDKDNIQMWQDILTAAARAEKVTYEART
jgi:histidine kinase/DNA gyrase B/HSP90-like ATPase